MPAVSATAKQGAAGPSESAPRASASRSARRWLERAVPLLGVLALPAALYAGALLARLWAIAIVGYPVNEGSAYYVAVAANIVEGRGLVSDALWSYATPPLVVPRPAFELWQPMASFVATLPMAVLGPTFDIAQLGAALLGALVAPLTWAVARDAAAAIGLERRRADTVAIGSGVLAAILGPFLFATAVPDSTVPFTVFGLACCWLMPRAVAGGSAAGLALGVGLGLAYLSRLEAVYLGLTVLLFTGRRWRVLPLVVVGGLVVAVPWLLRNAVAFGTLSPGQAVENLFFVRNEDVFAYLDRPSLARFLGQGVTAITDHIVTAFVRNAVEVVIVPAAPVGLIGAVAAVYLWRTRPALRRTALGALLLSGLITYLVISVLLPVASLWGTFQHAAGPMLCGLLVASALGMDALVARVRELRRWPRSNAWLAPLALLGLAVPMAVLQVAPLAALADEQQRRHAAVAGAVAAQPDVPPRLVTDHPVWLAEATGIPALALPDEPLPSLIDLAERFEAPMLVIVDERGRYPAELRTAEGRRCFEERPLGGDAAGSAIFVMRSECRP
jgi:hypothetical protein